jgi:hypothetical protein
MWSLGVTDNFHTTGVYTCFIPLSLMTVYNDWTEYLPEELNNQRKI